MMIMMMLKYNDDNNGDDDDDKNIDIYRIALYFIDIYPDLCTYLSIFRSKHPIGWNVSHESLLPVLVMW